MLTHRSRSSLAKIVILSVSIICLSSLLLPINQSPAPALAAPAELFFSEYVEGLSYQELADRNAVPLNTMRTWLRRSLIKLRECLNR